MKICYSKQIKSLDEKSIKQYSIPGVVLMENAGTSVVKEINSLGIEKKSAVILCGTGNNGGDGFVIARHLINQNWRINIIVCGEEQKVHGDALENLNILRKITEKIFFSNGAGLDSVAVILKESTIIVDALLGTGFTGELRDFLKSIINLVNHCGKYVVSVDVPSGLDCDSGFYEDTCIQANMTVTFQLAKLGLLINQGPECCGKLVVADISIPKKLIDSELLELNFTDIDIIKSYLKERKNNTHKGTYGKVFVVAGSKGMTGAAILSSSAAIKSGAGVVTLGLPQSVQDIGLSHASEIITKGFEDKNTGCFVKECIQRLIDYSISQDSVLIGPGIANNDDIIHIINELVVNCTKDMIIDADGLNALSNNIDILKHKQSNIILTPHPGEMSRLIGCSISDIQKDRVGMAKKLATQYKVITILKGFRTVLALPNGEIYINPTGNPGMATAGAGDVLAGIIAGLLGQGLNAEMASICGVYIHGTAGDTAAQNIGEYGLTASDIISHIPHTIKNITGK